MTHLPLVHTNTVFSFDIYESWTGIVKAGGDEGTDDSLRMRISTSTSRHARDEKAKAGILETVISVM